MRDQTVWEGLLGSGHWLGPTLALLFLCSPCFAQIDKSETTSDQAPTEQIDPFATMWMRAVEALDESYDQWNFRPEETVDSTTFTINYIASLATDGRRRLDRVMILHVDPNRDRSVTREEALGFLESQIGLRWVSGDRLRFQDGRVLVFSEFLRADTNQDDRISKQEFVVAMWDREGVDAQFSIMDLNGDGVIDLSEYADPKSPNFRNVIEIFNQADSSGDVLLDREELYRWIPMHRRHLLDSNLAAFDEDGDQALSMDEFRLSMLGNYNYPWEVKPEDRNRDGEISFDEFSFHPRDLFQLQKRYYFHRLDVDGDNSLSQDEFAFQQQRNHVLVSVDEKSNSSRLIFDDAKYPRLGSPVIRSGGEEVLFHAIPPEGEHQAVLKLVKIDGSETREIGVGLLPSWSPNGDRFVCSRYDGGSSVWIMGLNGTAHKRIDDGWGAQWSPDGRKIAYRNDNGIRLYEVSTGQSTQLFDKTQHPYRYVHPYFAWAPDSSRLAFFGELNREIELAVLSLTDDGDATQKVDKDVGNYEVKLRTSEAVNGELSWSADGRLLFSLRSREHGRLVIYEMDPDNDARPRVVDSFLELRHPMDVDLDSRADKMVVTLMK